ncbi:MAG: hypothetical protein ACE37M_04300 [Henriciella sp.]
MHKPPYVRNLALAALALGTCLSMSAQEADQDDSTEAAGKTCYVSKFKFENEGAYQLDLFQVGTHEYPGRLSQGKSRTWDIAKANVENGTNVFLTYRIHQGDNLKRRSCQKSGTKLLYHPDGNTWGYWSKGSSRYNNRCRFRNNTCITSVD